MVADLSHAKQSGYESQSSARELSAKLDQLNGVKTQKEQLEVNLAEKVDALMHMRKQLVAAEEERDGLQQLIQQQQVGLTAAAAKRDARKYSWQS